MTDDDGAQRREEQVLLRRLAAAGITQVDVSIMLGVGEPAISAWAQGHKRPNPDNLEALRALVEQAEAPPGTANGVQAELETRRRLAARRALAEEREAAAVRAEVAGELAALLGQVIERIPELRALKAAIDKGVHYEQFAARAGTLQRMTVPMQLPINAEIVSRAVQAGRELAALAGVDHEMAAIRAAQRMAG